MYRKILGHVILPPIYAVAVCVILMLSPFIIVMFVGGWAMDAVGIK